jgi:hypothetical protein
MSSHDVVVGQEDFTIASVCRFMVFDLSPKFLFHSLCLILKVKSRTNLDLVCLDCAELEITKLSQNLGCVNRPLTRSQQSKMEVWSVKTSV